MKRKMTFKETLQKDHYKSIIFLTLHYQTKKADKFEGLRAIHYRWALCPKHDGLDGSLFKGTLHKFFGEDLQELYDQKKVVKNSVTDRKNLSNFLRHLTREGFLKKKIKKNNTPFYFVSIVLQGYINKEATLNVLDNYNPLSVQTYPDPFKNNMLWATWFGSPDAMSKHASNKYGSFDLSDDQESFVQDQLSKMFESALRIYDFYDEMAHGMHPMNFVIEVTPQCPIIKKHFNCVFKNMDKIEKKD